VGEVEQILEDLGIGIKSINVSKDMENNEVEVEAITKVPSQQNTDKLISRLSHIQGIQGFEIQ
jgi:translation elongation factor EF-1beta